MKLNNKGFAITAILYALLILFSLTLITLIAGLNTRNKILEKSIETIEKKYSWDCIDESKDANIINLSAADKRGKYIFKSTTNPNLRCISYLKQNEEINPTNLEYTTTECNNTNKEELKLTEYCPDNNE